jgi:lysozyme
MEINNAGLTLIESFEGFSPTWYADPAHGWAVPTVAFGHTDSAGSPKYAETKNKVFTKAEGREILRRDLRQYAAAVEKAVKVPLNDNQFAALVSFTYNVGAGALAKSTLVKKLNAGNYGAVRSELAKWNKAGGKVMKGLTRRRAAEADLFEAKAASPAPVQPSPAPKPADDPVVTVPPAPKAEKKASKGPLAIIVGIILAGIAAWFGLG